MENTDSQHPDILSSQDSTLRDCKRCGQGRAIRSFGAVILLILTLSFARAQDGSYDPSFGSDGRTWIDVSSAPFDRARVMLTLRNGTLFVAGDCGQFIVQSCAAWLDATGAYALGYGIAGSGRASFPDFTGWLPTRSLIVGAVVLSDQRVAVLCAINAAGYGVAVLKADGSGLDTGVGNQGIVTLTAGSLNSIYLSQIALQSDGRIVIVGTATITNATPLTYSILAMRLLPNFTLDASFGSNGAATVQFPPIAAGVDTYASAVALQTDGKILLAGSTDSGSRPGDLAVARLNPNGTLDTSFGPAHDGRYRLQFGSSASWATAIALGAHGRIAIGGVVENDASHQWLVGRLLASGVADATFNFGQPQVFAVGASYAPLGASVTSVIEQSDGKLVAGGTVPQSANNYWYYFGVARFTTDGVFDSTFGAGGFSYGGLSNQVDSVNDFPSSFALTNGGLMIAGYSTVTNGEARFAVAKLRIDLIFANSFE